MRLELLTMLLQVPSEQHPSQEVIDELVHAVSDSDLFIAPHHVLTEALLPPAQIKEVKGLILGLGPARGEGGHFVFWAP
jgi:hypothetical protein